MRSTTPDNDKDEMMRTVALIHGDQIHRMIEQIISANDVLDTIHSQDRVVIKPNLVVSRREWAGVNTDPGVVEAIVNALKARSATIRHSMKFHTSTASNPKPAGLIKARISDYVRMIPLPPGHAPFVRIGAPANALSAGAPIRTKSLRELGAFAVQSFAF